MPAVVIVVLVVWLLALTSILGWLYFRVTKLLVGVTIKDLLSILDSIKAQEKAILESQKETKKELQGLATANLGNIQKVSLLRFNPFSEIGGEHSFSVALLDGYNKGFVMSALHTRDRTRVYLKEVVKGKSALELSKEETKVLKEAIKE